MKKPIVYAFIDSQNLNLGVQSLGWKLDYRRFRLYLKNKYNVSEAYLFIGMVPGNERMYSQLSQAGYHIVFKPTVIYTENGRLTTKGNVDAELVLYAAAKVYEQYDKAVIVSGDGDFACLHDYLPEKHKLLHVMVPNARFSKLLREQQKYIVRIDRLKDKVQYMYKNNRPKRSVETLGLPKHGDTIQ